jgi:hypothetical protein
VELSGSDEHVDEHQGEGAKSREGTEHDYVSTNLVWQKDITLADVIIEEVKVEHMLERLNTVALKHRFRFHRFHVSDPRQIFKER